MADVGLQYHQIRDFSGGMIRDYNYTTFQANQVLLILNGNIKDFGICQERFGTNKLINTPVVGNNPFTFTHTFPQVGADLLYGFSDTVLYETSTGAYNSIKTGLTAGSIMQAVNFFEYSFFVDGSDIPFMVNQGGSVYQVGIDAVTALQYAGFAGAPAALVGSVCTLGNHRVAIRYRSTITGAVSNPYIVGDIINGTTIINIAANTQYQITINAAAVSSDPQVDVIQVFVQLAGASDVEPYYFLGEVPNVNGSVGLFNFSDQELMVGEILDGDNNRSSANFKDIQVWRERLVCLDGDYAFRWSKIRYDANGIVNIPTSWPELNQINIGFGDGDITQKILIFNDFIFVFKKRSVWIGVGDFDNQDFSFKRLKTNYTNIGLLNPRCVCQGGNYCFFVTDDLKFFTFSSGDFNETILNLSLPANSDPIQSIFNKIVSVYRDKVSLVNFTFSEYNQVWISFTDIASGYGTGRNFNTLVYDYRWKCWSLASGYEVASSCLWKDALGNYKVVTSDYYGLLWQHGDETSYGDGAEINSTVTTAGATTITDVNFNAFTNDLIGCFIRVFDEGSFSSVNPENTSQIRRIINVLSADTVEVDAAFAIPVNAGQVYTIGGIDFQVQGREDWLQLQAPTLFEKLGWYFDLDFESNIDTILSNPYYTIQINFYTNRSSIAKKIRFLDTFDDASFWDLDFWDETNWSNLIGVGDVGFNLLFKTISHKIMYPFAGSNIKILGWMYTFQGLEMYRKSAS